MKSLLVFFVFASAHAQILRARRPAPYNPHQSSYKPPAPTSTPVRVRTSPSNWNEPPNPKSFVSTDPDEGYLIEIQMNDPADGKYMDVSELRVRTQESATPKLSLRNKHSMLGRMSR